MPGLQTVLGKLNSAFSRENIDKMVEYRERFAPGNPLAAGIVVTPRDPLYVDYTQFITRMPTSVQEAIRSIIYDALGKKPATLITFAWAPAYDYELAVWHAPDTRLTRGGITILVKSRYPDDPHPLANEPPYGSDTKT